MKALTNKYIVALMALFSCALWGSATPFIKKGYELTKANKDVPSTILFAGFRFFLAGLLIIVIYSLAKRKLLKPKATSIKYVLILSMCQTFIQYILFYLGLANTSGVKGTVLSAVNAFVSLLIAALIFRQERFTPKKLIAVILGFAGIIILNIKGLSFTMNIGDVFVILSTVSSSLSAVLIKRFSQDEDPVALSGYQFMLGGALMILVGKTFGGTVLMPNATSITVLVYLAFLSAIAYTLWGVLLKYNPVTSVTVYTFTIPIFGVILTMLMLNETPNVSPLNLILTLVLISTGIIMLNRQEK